MAHIGTQRFHAFMRTRLIAGLVWVKSCRINKNININILHSCTYTNGNGYGSIVSDKPFLSNRPNNVFCLLLSNKSVGTISSILPFILMLNPKRTTLEWAAYNYKQSKSEGFDSCDRPSNLTQIWYKSSICQPVWPWNLMDDLDN